VVGLLGFAKMNSERKGERERERVVGGKLAS
jgi:hypothetical protein